VVTMLPSLIVIFLGLDPTRVLVLSQVVLSFGLPFAIIPLVTFTSRRDIMGELTNMRITTFLASAVAVLIVALNVFLLYQTYFQRINSMFKHILVPLDGSRLSEASLIPRGNPG